MSSPLPKFGRLPETHHVPDLLAPGLKLVFCGTALGHVSARERAYYANPGNLFWRTLHETGLTPQRFLPKEYPQLLALGIGLTDLCKTDYGNDADLPKHALDIAALRQKIQRYQPRILAFTSKAGAAAFLGKVTSAIHYGFQPESVGHTRLYVLPSPSGHGRKYWQPKLWQALADVVKLHSPA